MSVKITKNALASCLQGAKETYPDEFLCLMASSRKNQTIDKILLAPLSEYGPTWSSYSDWHVPSQSGSLGTFHSHPNGALRPSSQDLRLFSSQGKLHAIAGPPFTAKNVAFFDNRGKLLVFRLLPDGSAAVEI